MTEVKPTERDRELALMAFQAYFAGVELNGAGFDRMAVVIATARADAGFYAQCGQDAVNRIGAAVDWSKIGEYHMSGIEPAKPSEPSDFAPKFESESHNPFDPKNWGV